MGAHTRAYALMLGLLQVEKVNTAFITKHIFVALFNSHFSKRWVGKAGGASEDSEEDFINRRSRLAESVLLI